MKTAQIIRLVCWSVAALFFAGLLIAGLSGNFFPGFAFGGIGGFGVDVAPDAQTGYAVVADHGYGVADEVSMAADGVTSIEINWVGGGVTVLPHDGSDVIFRQRAKDGDARDEVLSVAREANILIASLPSQMNWRIGVRAPSTYLEVYVPRELAESFDRLLVESASADVFVRGFYVQNLRVDTTSGDVLASSLSAPVLSLGSVSGNIGFDGSFGTVGADTVSGNISVSGPGEALYASSVSGDIAFSGSLRRAHTETTSGNAVVTSDVAPSEFSASSVSGETTLVIPEGGGFTVNVSKVSGRFTCDFPVVTSGSTHVCGDGSAAYDMDTVSGDVAILRLDAPGGAGRQ